MTSVTFVIPAYNEAETLDRVIDSVRSQEFDGDLEVIVVDDGSTDGTREIAEERADVLIQNKGNSGIAYTINRGLKAAGSEYVSILQGDCEIVGDDWIEKMFSEIEEDEDIALVSSHPVIPEEYFREFSLPAKFMFGMDYEDSVEIVEEESVLINPIKGNLCRSEALESVGGFREEMFSTAGEDTDLCLRLHKNGYRTRRAATAVNHMHGYNDFGFVDMLRKKFQYSEAKAVLKRQHPKEYSIGIWNESTKGLVYAGLLVPYVNRASVSLLLAYYAGFTYSLRRAVRPLEVSPFLVMKPFADLANVTGFVSGLVKNRQTA